MEIQEYDALDRKADDAQSRLAVGVHGGSLYIPHVLIQAVSERLRRMVKEHGEHAELIDSSNREHDLGDNSGLHQQAVPCQQYAHTPASMDLQVDEEASKASEVNSMVPTGSSKEGCGN